MGLFDLFKKKKDKKVEEINKKKNTDNTGINIKPTISVKTKVVNTPFLYRLGAHRIII